MPDLRWEDGVPVSAEFDDPYYSRADGLAETQHVFLDGNGLPDRWATGKSFHIGELGFGTGLNFCAAWQAWEASGATGRLNFTSFELHPLNADAIDEALRVWPELKRYRDALVAAWSPTGGTMSFGSIDLTVMIGDARATLPKWSGSVDAWFLDGFAPARNPQMWEGPLMAALVTSSAPGATFATYTVAGFVRRGLMAAGFDVKKTPGYGTKREMLSGILKNCDSSLDDV